MSSINEIKKKCELVILAVEKSLGTERRVEPASPFRWDDDDNRLITLSSNRTFLMGPLHEGRGRTLHELKGPPQIVSLLKAIHRLPKGKVARAERRSAKRRAKQIRKRARKLGLIE